MRSKSTHTFQVITCALCLAMILGCTGIVTETQPAPQSMHLDVPTSEVDAQVDESAFDLDEIVAELEGLSIDEFFVESYNQLLLRDPEYLTDLGIAAEFGLRNDRLNDLSEEYIRETQSLEVAILDLLRKYDRESLDPNQQISFDVYEWYLDDLVRGHEFMYHNYPVHHFLRSYSFHLDHLLTEIHPLRNIQDVEDYIARLSQTGRQIHQVLDGMKIRTEMGIIPPNFIIHMARGDMMAYLGMHSPDPGSVDPKRINLYTVFEEKLSTIPGISADERDVFLEQAAVHIAESFVPAYYEMIEYLGYLETIATEDAGVWKFPNGDAFYEYILRKESSSDLTPQEVHEIGLQEIVRIQAEMRAIFDELGYPANESLGASMARALQEAGYMDISTQSGKDRYVQEVERIIEEIDQELDAYFDLRPVADVIVYPGPWGGYYVAGSLDGSRPGAYHVSISGDWRSLFNMHTIAYHEAIPGHHFQIALAQEADLPFMRTDVFFNGYAEGWALYAEHLAWEIGMYENNPYGNLGRLQLELLRAVRLVVDSGIHALRWSREEARLYIQTELGDEQGGWTHEVERYIVLPGQATGYKIGMLKILELRQLAMDELGEGFDIKDFHNVVIGNGSVPLEILEELVLAYIEGG